MLNLSPALIAQFARLGVRLVSALDANPSLARKMDPIWRILKNTEGVLLRAVVQPSLSPRQIGHIDLGGFLYALNNLPIDLAILTNFLRRTGMPGTDITQAQVAAWDRAALSGTGIVLSDGSIVSTNKYCLLDPGWIAALLVYLPYYFGIDSFQPFRSNPAILRPTGNSLTLALAGDWGSGVWQDGSQPQCPSQYVFSSMLNHGADIAVHIGDVYYAGTEFGTAGLPPGEEEANFVNLWNGFQTNLALNSNHEMYDGGKGLMNIALNPNTQFAAQNGSTYFAIEFQNWVIFGLDTAYFDPSLLFLDGAFIDATQRAFVQSFDLTNKRVMVMTHHNGLALDGKSKTALWNDVYTALGNRDPDYWYWGHVHNGVVYDQQPLTGVTKARCLGHAALPYGNASALESNGSPIPPVLYYSHTPVGVSDPVLRKRVKNGYAIVKLTSSGLEETFYDQDGTVGWTNLI